MVEWTEGNMPMALQKRRKQMTTPLEILYNVGKLFMFVGAVFFIGLSILAQVTYWFRARVTPISQLPKKYRFLAKAAPWECFFFAGWFVLFIMAALCRVLWRMVTTGW